MRKWYERPLVGVAIIVVLLALISLAIVWSGVDRYGVQ